jgi:Na+/H+ antiporter NhaA
MLAFDSEIYITTSKIAILIASLIAALLGLVFLRIILAKQLAEETELID